MKLSELFSILQKTGPLSLSREFVNTCGGYDNSGIIVDCRQDVTGVLFSLDLSKKALAEAAERGFNTIVTHHPAIFGGIENLSANDPSTGLIFRCVKSGVSVISMHLNFDSAKEGIDYWLMRALGGDGGETMIKLSCGGYGRAYDVPAAPFGGYVKKFAAVIGSQRVLSYGDNKRIVRKAASFCGAGCDSQAIEFAAANSADAFVSSDIKHHHIAALLERGINVIMPTHYAAESFGFYKIYQKIIEELAVPHAFLRDEDLV